VLQSNATLSHRQDESLPRQTTRSRRGGGHDGQGSHKPHCTRLATVEEYSKLLLAIDDLFIESGKRESWTKQYDAKFIKEAVQSGTGQLQKVTVNIVKAKCKNANHQNLLKNLDLLKNRAKKVDAAVARVLHIRGRRRNMPVIPIAATGDPITISGEEEQIEDTELVKKEKKSQSVMLYTTITFAAAIAIFALVGLVLPKPKNMPTGSSRPFRSADTYFGDFKFWWNERKDGYALKTRTIVNCGLERVRSAFTSRSAKFPYASARNEKSFWSAKNFIGSVRGQMHKLYDSSVYYAEGLADLYKERMRKEPPSDRRAEYSELESDGSEYGEEKMVTSEYNLASRDSESSESDSSLEEYHNMGARTSPLLTPVDEVEDEEKSTKRVTAEVHSEPVAIVPKLSIHSDSDDTAKIFKETESKIYTVSPLKASVVSRHSSSSSSSRKTSANRSLVCEEQSIASQRDTPPKPPVADYPLEDE